MVWAHVRQLGEPERKIFAQVLLDEIRHPLQQYGRKPIVVLARDVRHSIKPAKNMLGKRGRQRLAQYASSGVGVFRLCP
jgi:hypothetical protein